MQKVDGKPMTQLTDTQLQRLLNAARMISRSDSNIAPDVIAACEELQERRKQERKESETK